MAICTAQLRFAGTTQGNCFNSGLNSWYFRCSSTQGNADLTHSWLGQLEATHGWFSWYSFGFDMWTIGVSLVQLMATVLTTHRFWQFTSISTSVHLHWIWSNFWLLEAAFDSFLHLQGMDSRYLFCSGEREERFYYVYLQLQHSRGSVSSLEVTSIFTNLL